MTQSGDYYEDCRLLTKYSPPPTCCNCVPTPCCSNYSNCCEKRPCLVRTVYPTPACTPRCVERCCITPCNRYCELCSSCNLCCEYPCEPVTYCSGPKKKVLCCVADDNCCEKYDESTAHWILGIVLLAAFAMLIFNFNDQLMSPPKRRFFT